MEPAKTRGNKAVAYFSKRTTINSMLKNLIKTTGIEIVFILFITIAFIFVPVTRVSGAYTTQPFPIDRGGESASTPTTYKGLLLRLTNNGKPTITAVDGRIGVVCVGMSNGIQECDDYVKKVLIEPFVSKINPQVKVVNCALGSHAIERWNNPAYDSVLWDSCINSKIPSAGLRPDQVRVIYHKAADQETNVSARYQYPDPKSDYFNFYNNLTTFANRVPVKFPSVQAVYTTSRSYGGFATNAIRGEPLSYEEGHALNKWLLDHPKVSGVWYGWGPYIWAPDCATGITNKNGVCYVRSDYQSDGVHPEQTAKNKISKMIHNRFLSQKWYAVSTSTTPVTITTTTSGATVTKPPPTNPDTTTTTSGATPVKPSPTNSGTSNIPTPRTNYDEELAALKTDSDDVGIVTRFLQKIILFIEWLLW